MKFQITRSAFIDGIRKVQNVISGRDNLAILQNVKIDATETGLTLTTTDLDITIKCQIDAEVKVPGSTTLPAKLLAAAISKAEDGVIEVAVDEKDQATITSGHARYRLAGKSSRDFPVISESEETSVYTISKAVLGEMFRKTAYAASQEDTRRALKGVLLSFKNGKLTMVATDGRRMAKVEQELEFPAVNENDIIVPSKAVAEIVRSLSGEGDAKIIIRKANLCCEVDGVRIFSKLIDDTYPNYNVVIPTNLTETVQVDRQLLMKALERASVMSMDESRATLLTFEANLLTVSSGQSDIGEVKDEVAIKYIGEKIETGFNPAYIMDALRAIDDDEVTIKISNGHTPIIIACSVPFIYVLMPLRQK